MIKDTLFIMFFLASYTLDALSRATFFRHPLYFIFFMVSLHIINCLYINNLNICYKMYAYNG